MRALKFRRWVYGDDAYHYIDLEDIRDFGFFSLDAGPIEQYTGLMDIDGNEIYEGDFLTRVGFRPGNFYLVVYHEVECAYMLSYSGRNIGSNLTKGDIMDNYKKIGNIHENSELLND